MADSLLVVSSPAGVNRKIVVVAHRLTTIGFKLMILGRIEGGRLTRRTSTTDNALKIFILKPM